MFIFFLFFCFLVILLCVLVVLNLFLKINYKLKMKNEISPFECGFVPFHFMRVAFSLRFFMIALVFLVFDVELTLLLPVVFTKFILTTLSFFFFFFFLIFILLVGLFFEWEQGVFNWSWLNI